MLQGCSKGLEAVSQGKTLILFRWSLFSPDLPDVLTTLPSLEEFQTIQGILAIDPEQEAVLEHALCERHVLSPSVYQWLLSEAPAGMLSSICMGWMLIGFPNDQEEISTLLNAMRGFATYYDDFKRILYTHSSATPSDLTGMDLHKLLTYLVGVEKHMLEAGIMEDRIKLERRGQRASQNTFAADAAKMQRELG